MTAASLNSSGAILLLGQALPAPSTLPEKLSALADGALEPDELPQLLQAKSRPLSALGQEKMGAGEAVATDALLECWSTYHLIGEALRTPGQPAEPADAAFLARFRQAVQNDAVRETPLVTRLANPAPPVEAANDPVFRWKLVAGFASLTAVCAVAWQMAGLGLSGVQAPQEGLLVQQKTPPSVLVATQAGAMLQNSRMEELLAAHRQHGGGSAVQMPGPFLRNAAFAVDAPGR